MFPPLSSVLQSFFLRIMFDHRKSYIVNEWKTAIRASQGVAHKPEDRACEVASPQAYFQCNSVFCLLCPSGHRVFYEQCGDAEGR